MTTSAYGGKNFKFGSTGVGEKPFDLGKEIQQTLGVLSSEEPTMEHQSPGMLDNTQSSPFVNVNTNSMILGSHNESQILPFKEKKSNSLSTNFILKKLKRDMQPNTNY